ncbi:MAG: hypothetical protein HC896_06590 [Bacteroidales bacterium]|nr:hypothetical protein [Bacteroidales bacterium]
MTKLSTVLFFFYIVLFTSYGINRSEIRFTIIIGPDAGEALQISANDLSAYVQKTIKSASVATANKLDLNKTKGNIIAVGNRENNSLIKELASEGSLGEAPRDWNSFTISTIIKGEATIYVLEGADLMGQQYACYDFIEKALGVRFLGVDIEYVPELEGIGSPINTGVQNPQFKWRGLQIWNYHYDQRGTGSFCDINDRYLANDWEWYKKMADWLVKNKQNYVQWYDETMGYVPMSSLIEDEVIDYFAMRGIKRLIGLGWAANEGKPKEWKLAEGLYDTSKVCIGADGKPIGHEHEFTIATCPKSEAYFPLAEQNINAFDFSKNDIIGAVIGYGETKRSQTTHNGCIRHPNITALELIQKDRMFAREKIDEIAQQNINLGYVVMDFGGSEASLRSKKMFDALPDSSILFLWTYRDFGWKGNENTYQWVQEAANEGRTIQIFQQAEVDFICQSDLPLYRFDIWETARSPFQGHG